MKRGVTLIELIFVIVVIGILSAVIAPSFTRPTLSEAANQLVSHIRYTQHLAMVDNKFDPNNQFWYRQRWQLKFQAKKIDGQDRVLYTIFNDRPSVVGGIIYNGNASTVVNNNEIAKNPLNPSQLLTGLSSSSQTNSKEMILNEKYGIEKVEFSTSCNRYSSNRIIFDYLGRPLFGNSSTYTTAYRNDNDTTRKLRLIQGQCIIKLCLDKPCRSGIENFIRIAIEPETGYTHVLPN